jgi:hypothetical protein
VARVQELCLHPSISIQLLPSKKSPETQKQQTRKLANAKWIDEDPDLERTILHAPKICFSWIPPIFVLNYCKKPIPNAFWDLGWAKVQVWCFLAKNDHFQGVCIRVPSSPIPKIFYMMSFGIKTNSLSTQGMRETQFENDRSILIHIIPGLLKHSNFVFRQNGRNSFKNGRIRAV